MRTTAVRRPESASTAPPHSAGDEAGSGRWLRLAEEAERELSGSSQREWLGRVDAQWASIRGAIEHALAEGCSDVALRTAAAMVTFWHRRGYLQEGVCLLERCLAGVSHAEPLARAKASWGSGWLAVTLGDLQRAESRGEESLRLAREVGDHEATARAMCLLGVVAMRRGEGFGASGLLKRSVAIARRAADPRCLVNTLEHCGHAHLLLRDSRGALPLFYEAFQLGRAAMDRQAEARALLGLGGAAIDLGEYEAGEARIRLGEDLARSVGDRVGSAEAMLSHAWLACLRGNLDEAEGLLDECRELAREIHAPLVHARVLGGLAEVAIAQQRYGGVQDLLDRAISIAREVGGEPRLLTRLLVDSSACAIAMGQLESADAALQDALATARRFADRRGESSALYGLGRLARERGDSDQAGRLCGEALHGLDLEKDDRAIARCLEGIAGAALDNRRFVFAARLFGAADGCWEHLGRYAGRWPSERERRERDLARLDEALGTQALGEALTAGAARPLDDIVSYALRGGGGGRGSCADAAGLTESELAVARLAASGLTSREVAARMFISPRTVEAHLAKAYRKLGLHSRRELRAVVARFPPDASRETTAGFCHQRGNR